MTAQRGGIDSIQQIKVDAIVNLPRFDELIV
jgi:hypothetical protein